MDQEFSLLPRILAAIVIATAPTLAGAAVLLKLWPRRENRKTEWLVIPPAGFALSAGLGLALAFAFKQADTISPLIVGWLLAPPVIRRARLRSAERWARHLETIRSEHPAP